MENSSDRESSLTVKWWGVLILIFAMIGWIYISIVAAQDRITKLEMSTIFVADSLKELKGDVKKISGDLTEYINKTRGNGK